MCHRLALHASRGPGLDLRADVTVSDVGGGKVSGILTLAWKCIQKRVALKIAGFAWGCLPPDALKWCNQKII